MKNKIKAAVLTAAVVAGMAVAATPAQAGANAPTIGDGYANNSTAVWCVQRSLNAVRDVRWAPVPEVDEDGIWGPSTKAAVKAFQTWRRLPADGYVGKVTGDELLTYGDSYYNGWSQAQGYCYPYIPSEY